MLPLIIPVIFTWTMGHADDAEMHEEMRQNMMNIIHSLKGSEQGISFHKTLARTLTEKLLDRKLSFAERKIYRELLDATLDVLRTEEELNVSESATM